MKTFLMQNVYIIYKSIYVCKKVRGALKMDGRQERIIQQVCLYMYILKYV